MTIPETMLVALTTHGSGLPCQPSISAPNLPPNINTSTLRDALLNPELDGPTVAFFIDTFLTPEPSPAIIRTVVSTLFDTVTSASHGDFYQHVLRLLGILPYLQNGTCKEQLLCPIDKAFAADCLQREHANSKVCLLFALETVY